MSSDPGSNSSLSRRLVSALVIAPCALFIIYLGGVYFKTLITLGLLLALWEWFGMAKRAENHQYLLLYLGVLYLSLCGYAFMHLRFGLPHGAWLAIAVVLVVAASDTVAYFVGRRFGKRKLAPKISPKKTWAGLYGAMIGAAVMAVLLAFVGSGFEIRITDFPQSDGLYYFSISSLGLFLGVVGQVGDLLISKMKRYVHVKDTGKVIPGHGGILDRVDALILVETVFTGLIVWL